MNIQRRLIKVNYSTATNGRLGICIHTMVGTLAGTDSHFKNPASQVSSHYGVDLTTPTIYQWVEEKHTAWAQGRVSNPTNPLVKTLGGNPNGYFISIECADNGNPAGADRSIQIPILAQLVGDIAKRNNIPLDRAHVCGHREIYDKKSCPGNLYPELDKIISLAQQSQQPTPMDKRPYWFDLMNKVIWNKPHEQITDDMVNSFVKDYPTQLSRSGKWDQLCIKAGLVGDTNKVTVDQLYAALNTGVNKKELIDKIVSYLRSL